MKLRHLLWKIFGRPEFPPKIGPIKRLTLNDPRKEWMYFYYRTNLLSVTEIAEYYNVTRERVRQCLWAVYWRNNE